MNTSIFCVLLCLICYGECGRRVLQPLDKNANLEFISMEGGARTGALGKPNAPTSATKPAASSPVAVDPTKIQAEAMRPGSPVKPAVEPPKTPEAKPQKPAVAPAPQKPGGVATPPPKIVAPVTPNLVKTPATPPKSLPQPGATATTPGPGSVQQLINYYDSRGQASPIRPYSYSQAVKQGRQH